MGYQYCPECRQLVNTTEYYHHNKRGKLLRKEVECDKCHRTLEVYHYQVEETE